MARSGKQLLGRPNNRSMFNEVSDKLRDGIFNINRKGCSRSNNTPWSLIRNHKLVSMAL